MRTIRLYTTQSLSIGTESVLEAAPSHHLATVLRAKTDQPVELFNGDGNSYSARIVALQKKSVTVVIDACTTTTNESPLAIHLGIGISKGDRFDYVLQKSTELGVTAITPLLTERVEVRLDYERGEKKLEHWRQVVISACEQSGRNVVPLVHAPQKLADWTAQCQAERKFVLHHRADAALSPAQKPKTTALLIGPEGGLSQAEIALAQNNGFEAWRLGPRVLRTETAPLAAITALQWIWGDLADQ
jgi:16S rRNA (uracil1498-N3)-methyltransferase